jgi:hypothetical protein
MNILFSEEQWKFRTPIIDSNVNLVNLIIIIKKTKITNKKNKYLSISLKIPSTYFYKLLTIYLITKKKQNKK